MVLDPLDIRSRFELCFSKLQDYEENTRGEIVWRIIQEDDKERKRELIIELRDVLKTTPWC